MEFRILGPLEVVDGDRSVSLDAPKQRALLGVLLLHSNEVVSTERLIDELWGDRPPPTAAKVLQTYVSQLRKALSADAIVTRAPGYQLNLDRSRLDADEFGRLTTEARRLAADRDAEQAAARYREALALWRGPALGNVAFESFARNEVDRLEEERLTALLDRIDCDLVLGRHDELVAELEELVGHHPLRERLRAQLMLTLYRAGRQSEALGAYQQGRRLLTDELGLEPGQELRDLERAILAQDPALQAPPRPSRMKLPRRRFGGWRVAVVGAFLFAAAALALAFALDGAHGPSGVVAANSVAFIDAASGEVTRSFPVGREPSALTIANNSLWVANYRDQTVSRVDVRDGKTATIPVGAHPTGIAFLHGRVWVWTLEELLVPIDMRFDIAGKPIRLVVPGRPRFVRTRDRGQIVAGDGFLWLTAPGTTVIRVDPDDPRSRLVIVPDAGTTGPLAYGHGEVWVAATEFVVPITAKSGVPRSQSAVGGPVWGVAVAGDSLWVVSGGPNRTLGVSPALRRIDPRTRLVRTTLAVGQAPRAVAAAADSIWVASRNDRDGMIYRVDSTGERILTALNVAAQPTALTPDETGVWFVAT